MLIWRLVWGEVEVTAKRELKYHSLHSDFHTADPGKKRKELSVNNSGEIQIDVQTLFANP